MDASKKAEEKPADAPKQADASLEDLLEDDEFEEFEAEGQNVRFRPQTPACMSACLSEIKRQHRTAQLFFAEIPI